VEEIKKREKKLPQGSNKGKNFHGGCSSPAFSQTKISPPNGQKASKKGKSKPIPLDEEEKKAGSVPVFIVVKPKGGEPTTSTSIKS